MSEGIYIERREKRTRVQIKAIFIVIPYLPANSSERVELNWDISEEVPGGYTILVIINPENEIQESNEKK